MREPRLDLLVLADLHYALPNRPEAAAEPLRKMAWGRLLFRKVLRRVRHMGRWPDALVLLGDLVEDGGAADAESLLKGLAAEAEEAGLFVLAVAGNHDPTDDSVARVFDSPTGFREFGGYGFLLIRDEVGPGDFAARPPGDLVLPVQAARAHPDLPLVAVQHNPIFPPIESSYPFLPTNAEAIAECYEEAGVILSLSGHYHCGNGPIQRGPTLYRTTPALCESPFRFDYVRLRGRRVEVETHALRLEVPGLTDVHCHTELAYCATTVRAEENVAISRAMGVSQICLTEHAFQLYMPEEEAWSFRWQTDRPMAERCLAGPTRMEAYRALAGVWRGDASVRIGLEVDWREGEGWLLRPGDADGWDLLVGGVHLLPGYTRETVRKAKRAELERLFIRQVEDLLSKGISVLAHPFRIFIRWGLEEPTALHDRLVEMLKAADTAAEINFHDHPTSDRFYRECLVQGVRLALGTDSHDLSEVGELFPHLEVLKRIGVDPTTETDRLFRLS